MSGQKQEIRHDCLYFRANYDNYYLFATRYSVSRNEVHTTPSRAINMSLGPWVKQTYVHMYVHMNDQLVYACACHIQVDSHLPLLMAGKDQLCQVPPNVQAGNPRSQCFCCMVHPNLYVACNDTLYKTYEVVGFNGSLKHAALGRACRGGQEALR